MLSLWRHALRVLYSAIPRFHQLLHLDFVDAFVPDWMAPRQQVEHNDTTGPHVSFLGIGKIVRYLLGWLVKERATLGVVHYSIE